MWKLIKLIKLLFPGNNTQTVVQTPQLVSFAHRHPVLSFFLLSAGIVGIFLIYHSENVPWWVTVVGGVISISRFLIVIVCPFHPPIPPVLPTSYLTGPSPEYLPMNSNNCNSLLGTQGLPNGNSWMYWATGGVILLGGVAIVIVGITPPVNELRDVLTEIRKYFS